MNTPTDPLVSPAGRPLIYVVEDDPLMSEVVVLALQQSGFRTRTFHDGQEAWDAFQSDATRPSLMITDNNMPGMTGRELGGLCRKAQPGLKVISISGGLVSEDLVADGNEPDFLLPKPFLASELVALVRAIVP
jgi:DNA-binding response OmpR family regulator